MFGLFKEVARSTPLAPCERFGRCEHYEKCKHEELACEQFWVYVNKSSTRGRVPSKQPKKKIYDRIFNEGDDE